METLLPPTVRQARWFIVGGLVAAVMGTVFLGLALASLAAGIIRIRRGDDPGRPSGPTRT